jgi:hypothetical protein
MAIRLAKYFGNFGAVLAQPAGRFCGVSRQEQILQGTKAIKTLAAGAATR